MPASDATLCTNHARRGTPSAARHFHDGMLGVVAAIFVSHQDGEGVRAGLEATRKSRGPDVRGVLGLDPRLFGLLVPGKELLHQRVRTPCRSHRYRRSASYGQLHLCSWTAIED